MPVLQLFSKQSYMNRVKTLCRNTTIILVVLSSTIVLAQKRDKKTEFNKFVDNYYEEGLLFNPIAATQRGDNRYNDLLPNDITVPAKNNTTSP
jgi:hypothetical protein